tara:strand:- start:4 stop:1638 length:1635 start_codon:yes stop_codon:yes gene_type:complete
LVDDNELVDRIRRFQALSVSYIFSNEPPTNRKIPAHIKRKVLEAAGKRCPICSTIMISTPSKKTPLDRRESTPDHIVDLCIGGNNTDENFLILCHKCNWAKAHALNQHLKIPGMPQGTPGQDSWRRAFRSKPSNIAKLFEYIEWSFRINEPLIENQFPELHGILLKKEPVKPKEPKSTSRKRPEKPENTLWRRFTRFLGGLFGGKPEKPQMKPKKSRINLLTESSEFPKLDFTPGDFAAGLLRQKKREQPVTFTTLYDRLIKEDPSFNLKNLGIKPSAYLVSNCSDLLLIEFKDPHHWISKIHVAPPFTPEEFVKGLLRYKTREGQAGFNFLYGRLIKENPKFKLPHYGIKPSSYLQEECSSLLSIEKRMHKNGTTSTLWIEEDRKCSFCNELGHHIDDCERLAKRKASLEDESRKADREAEILLAGLGKVGEDKKKATQKEGISEFKLIIEEIIRDSEQKTADGRHIITISALGQRFSKRVQATGFGNKKEYFQQKGLDPSMSISKAIHAYFSEEEIEFVGERIWTGSHFKTNHTHVVLNRRG